MNRFAAPLLNGERQSGTEQGAAAVLSHHAAQHCKHKAFSQVPHFDPFTFLPDPGWASRACLSITLSKSQTDAWNLSQVSKGVTLQAARLVPTLSQTENGGHLATSLVLAPPGRIHAKCCVPHPLYSVRSTAPS